MNNKSIFKDLKIANINDEINMKQIIKLKDYKTNISYVFN